VGGITTVNLACSAAVGTTRLYNGTTTATVDFSAAALVTPIGGDVVSINSSGYSASFANKTVATGKPVTVTGVTLSGGDAGNYTETGRAARRADIAARDLAGGG